MVEALQVRHGDQGGPQLGQPPRLGIDPLPADRELAQLEMTRKGKQAALGAGMFGASGLVAFYGVGCLLACAIIAISGVMAAWLAALIVGVILLATAGIAALLGKQRLQRATPPVPKEAVAELPGPVKAAGARAAEWPGQVGQSRLVRRRWPLAVAAGVAVAAIVIIWRRRKA